MLPSFLQVRRTATAAAASLLVVACGSDGGGDGGTGVSAPIVVATVITPSALLPGESFSATVTATPPEGEQLSWVKVEVRGLVTAVDSVPVEGSGSATLTRVFTVPRSAANGAITVIGTGRAAAGRTGRGQANVAVNDTVRPTLQLSLPSSVSTLQPGDSLRFQYSASDNVLLRYTVVRITGAFSMTDSIEIANGPPSVNRAVALRIPSSARLGAPINVSVEAVDYAGNRSTRSVGPLAYNDVTPPALAVSVTGGRSVTAFVPGDVLTLAITASDQHQLARIGYTISAPGTGGEAFPVANGAASASRTVTIPILASWSGNPSYIVYAIDSSGNRRDVTGSITVASRVRRAIVTTAATGAVRDVAVDTKRGLAYLSTPSTNMVRVLDIATGGFRVPYSFPAPPGGLDLTLSGDSLMVAMSGGPFVRAVSLATGQQDTIRVIEPGDTRSVANLRVMADATMLVTITFGGSGYGGSIAEYDLATRTRRSRVTVTEAVPLARSGNRQRAVAIIDDSCCPLGGLVYDSFSSSWAAERGTVSRYFVALSLDYTGNRVLVHTSLFSGTLAPLGSFAPAGTTVPAVLAADGGSAFWATSTGVARVRFSDGAVLETFSLGSQPTGLFLSQDALTLIAVTAGAVHAIDLW